MCTNAFIGTGHALVSSNWRVVVFLKKERTIASGNAKAASAQTVGEEQLSVEYTKTRDAISHRFCQRLRCRT